MTLSLILFYVIVINNAFGSQQENKVRADSDFVVTVPGLGSLRGGVGLARNNHEYFEFLGVPYATPPTGKRRFSRPEFIEPWEGVRNATEYREHCLQRHNGQIVGSEDCLYVNIFTKNLNISAKSPVIFYIHGGAFVFGGIQLLGPQYILEEDVVLVTVQYRLNAFGFLSTEDSVSPGNYGLHDQVAALQWVHHHIKHFGGDPEQVTLMGLSAGGASVHYLLLSSQTHGLFHKAVSFSGSALCWWANLPNHATTAKQLAGELGCPINSSISMLECLREKSSMELMKAQSQLYSWHRDKIEQEPMNVWSPRADPEAGPHAILPLEPIDAIQKGMVKEVPLMISLAESEGIWKGINYVGQQEVLEELLDDFDTIAPLALGLKDDITDGALIDTLHTLKAKYLESGTGEINIKGLIDVLGDSMFNHPVLEMVQQHVQSSHSPLWVFLVSYQHSHSLAALVAKQMNLGTFHQLIPELKLATHAAELSLMFPHFVHILGPLTEEETQISKNFIRVLMEFVVHGVPSNKEWKDVTKGGYNFINIGKYNQVQQGLPFQDRMQFWNDLPVYWKKNKDSSSNLERMQTEL